MALLKSQPHLFDLAKPKCSRPALPLPSSAGADSSAQLRPETACLAWPALSFPSAVPSLVK